ncbi:hypothetical protein F2Q68_00025744 [Brassica cretica]|uniref:Uncharacterized protein n=1 Tax=Brassica cretica TaxID=69181 RepID=A0A8S9I8I2_BRACR|nr:hypothetical protein F2Q68_00025744 [Brassica cretica]
MRVFNAALVGSFRESCISHFKAEEAERELFRFRKEVEEQSQRQAGLYSRAFVRVERRGKRAIIAEMKRRAALLPPNSRALRMLKNSWAIFASAVARLLPSTSRGTRTSLFLPRVRQLWDSIEVSEDTAEAGTGVGDEGAGVADREVDQPVSSFGISMSGFLDF